MMMWGYGYGNISKENNGGWGACQLSVRSRILCHVMS